MSKVVQQLLRRLPGGYWLSRGLEDVRRRTASIHFSDGDFNVIVEAVPMHLGQARIGRTTNLLILGLLLDEDRFLKGLRSKGALRPSKYDFDGVRIRDCVAPLLEHADRIGISSSSRRYLASLCALSAIANGARQLRGHLRDLIRDGRTIKSLLVAVDMLFLMGHEAQRSHFPPNAWKYHSKEDLAEGFSIAIHQYRSSGNQIRDAELGGPVDPKTLTSDTYENLLAECAIFRQYHEWEFEVDSGTYQADIEEDTIVLRPADERVEKATRLGYILSNQSRIKSVIQDTPEDTYSLAALAEQLHQVLKQSGLLWIKDEPIRRLLLGVPALPEFVGMINGDGFYAEEVAYLKYTGLSFFVAPDDLPSFVVHGKVTVHDLMKVWRMMNLLRQVLRLEIRALLPTEPETAAQSVLPVFSKDQLLTLLSMAVGNEKAEELIDFWEWTGAGVFDLQYQPFVRADTSYTVPLNVFGDSDIVRNAFQLARVRIHHQDDPSERALVNAFEARHLPTRRSVGYRYDEQTGEIDVLAVLDGIAFAFECKNSLLPANPFELRQTLTYLEKANDQLDRLRLYWEEPAFVQALRQRTGLNLVPGMPLVTCAVTANRMLSGSIYGRHPVRGLFELGSFLHKGGVELLGQTVHVIKGAEVSGEDLRAYIESDSLHARILSAMVAHEPIYDIGTVKVVRRTFALSLLRVAEEFGLDVPQELKGTLEDNQADTVND